MNGVRHKKHDEGTCPIVRYGYNCIYLGITKWCKQKNRITPKDGINNVKFLPTNIYDCIITTQAQENFVN